MVPLLFLPSGTLCDLVFCRELLALVTPAASFACSACPEPSILTFSRQKNDKMVENKRGMGCEEAEGAGRGGQEGTGWGGVVRGPDGGRKGRNAREMKREGAGPVGALDWKMRCKGGRKGTEMRRGGINGRGWESGAGPRMCPGALCSRAVPPLFRISYNFAIPDPIQPPKIDGSAIIKADCFCWSVV